MQYICKKVVCKNALYVSGTRIVIFYSSYYKFWDSCYLQCLLLGSQFLTEFLTLEQLSIPYSSHLLTNFFTFHLKNRIFVQPNFWHLTSRLHCWGVLSCFLLFPIRSHLAYALLLSYSPWWVFIFVFFFLMACFEDFIFICS